MKKAFENIVKVVSPDDTNYIDNENEKLIIFENGTSEFYEKNNFSLKAKRLLGYTYTYYVVNFSEFLKIEKLSCELTDVEKGIIINLEMSFEISCIRKGVQQAIEFLRNTNDPITSLKRSLTTWIRKFAKDHAGFSEDFPKFDRDIRLHIKKQSARQGLLIDITHFIPSYDSDFASIPEHIAFVHTTICEVLDYQIEVKSKIVVNLVNRSVFKWRNLENPEQWIKEKTDSIIQNELISMSFLEIIENFDISIKNNILEKLNLEIKNIGYSIQHIVSVPSQEIADFLDGFTIELDHKLKYATSKTEIKVPLSVTVEGKGTILKGVNPKYIKPKKSIIEAVKKESIQVIASIIRNTPPENYYTKFDALSSEIKDRLYNVYTQNFRLDTNDLRISISPFLTELEDRYNKLFAEYGHITIESQSEFTYYEIRFGVAHVNNWFVFHKNHIKYYNQTTLEYQDISDYIKNNIELEVKRIESADIKNIDSRSLDEGIVKLFKDSQYIITEEFGLQLKNPRLKRVKKSDGSSNYFDIQLLLQRKEDIKRELTQALLAEDDELVDELSEKLEKIDKHIEDTPVGESSQLFKTNETIKKIENNGDAT